MSAEPSAAMHVAAMQPQYVDEDGIPADVLQKEEEIILETLNDGQKAKAVYPPKINLQAMDVRHSV